MDDHRKYERREARRVLVDERMIRTRVDRNAFLAKQKARRGKHHRHGLGNASLEAAARTGGSPLRELHQAVHRFRIHRPAEARVANRTKSSRA